MRDFVKGFGKSSRMASICVLLPIAVIYTWTVWMSKGNQFGRHYV